ncbi:protein kinase domain-containing protein [Legionella micdadei]|uniref:Putative Mitogen-activated protein kinase [STPK domain] n=1 Tax=Legionella micdadei TaxID=451 RepID=A0A098GEE4_LEGMI|nr:protein kinase [Legionella micdadei]ARG97586.1 hypothetical protein B6N58_07860 [Legionella micdadei]ARH00102.1 hypothetical protein B6V88_06565 [Legionella micdadei]KTD27666.1 serine/threonine-protein kinase [Legionella micdadei]NSL17650.1 protein kinase [Legionella micdadei]CEG60848.1 putative Mitogen-activated protein kinase [STPK domain] [Legionella micdadei]
MPISINPSAISHEHSQKLARFFNTQSADIRVWKQGQIYTFEDGTEFQFTSDVVKRDRKEGKSGFRYEFLSNRLLGKGQFGEVYEIEGTLAVASDDVQFKPHGLNGKTRVVKIQKHNADNPIRSAFVEYNLSKEASHLGIKLPTIEGTTSYTVMKKLKGKELFDIIALDYDYVRPLTLKERVELTKLLLNAVKEQVTDKGIIHRDLKGENILVDLNSDPIGVNIFDFGLSVKADQPDGKCCGSPVYAPPEIFYNQEQTVKIDVFSLGRVLALIWHVDLASYNCTSIERCARNAQNVDLSSLFMGISGLDSENQKIIRSMLEGMLRADARARLSIEEAIHLFSRVNLDRPIDYRESVATNKSAIAATLGLPEDSSSSAFLAKAPSFISGHLKGIVDSIEELQNPDNQTDLDFNQVQQLDSLVNQLNIKINQLREMVSENRMENFAAEIQAAGTLIRENKATFENNKVGFVIANILFGFITLGTFHAALAIYSFATSKNDFAFFKEIKTTKASEIVENIEEDIQNLGNKLGG